MSHFLPGGSHLPVVRAEQELTEPRSATVIEHTDSNELLTPGEVAEIFHVNPKTVTRWSRAGKIPAMKTLGGHRRFRERDVRAAFEALASDA